MLVPKSFDTRGWRCSPGSIYSIFEDSALEALRETWGTCIQIHMHTCIYMYIHIYIYMYTISIHTHIYIQFFTLLPPMYLSLLPFLGTMCLYTITCACHSVSRSRALLNWRVLLGEVLRLSGFEEGVCKCPSVLGFGLDFWCLPRSCGSKCRPSEPLRS